VRCRLLPISLSPLSLALQIWPPSNVHFAPQRLDFASHCHYYSFHSLFDFNGTPIWFYSKASRSASCPPRREVLSCLHLASLHSNRNQSHHHPGTWTDRQHGFYRSRMANTLLSASSLSIDRNDLICGRRLIAYGLMSRSMLAA
jgi:hypothetical protein